MAEALAAVSSMVVRLDTDENEISDSDESLVQRTGLHLVHEPDDARLIIVAIHGPFGSWKRSWQHAKSKYFWLKDAIPEKIPTARVYSFAYRDLSVSSTANDLLGDLVDVLPEDQEKDLPIVFVGHSLGGVIAKQAFLSSHRENTIRKRYRRLHGLIKSFVFLGTDQYQGFDPNLVRWSSIFLGTDQYQGLDPFLVRWNSMRRVTSQNHERSTANELLLLSHKFAALGGERLVSACFWETERSRSKAMMAVKRSGDGVDEFVVDKPMAVLNWKWVHEEGLKGTHITMCQFERASGNCAKVIGVLKEVVETISPAPLPPLIASTISPSNGPVYSLPSTSSKAVNINSSSEGLRILSLDGGGVKGLFAVVVLQAIMEQVRRIDCPDNADALRPCDYFELICGTSTGGLLAIMLGRLRMDLVSCRDAYRRMSSNIFSEWRIPLKMYVWDAPLGNPWYSGKKMEAAIKEILSARISTLEKENLGSKGIPPEEAPMLNGLDPSPQKARTLVCAVQDNAEGKAGKCERLRAYDCDDKTRPRAWSGKIWEACRATSAAPVYFEHIEVHRKCYFDGGLISNNPIQEVYKEAQQEYPGRHFEAIVSIGTGKPPYKSPPRTLFTFMKQAMDQMTNTEVKHVAFLDEIENVKIGGGEIPDGIEGEHLGDRYFRLNDAETLYKIDLAAYRQLDKVEKAANDFVSSAAGSKTIQDCAYRLAFHRPIRS